jgi:PAS domain S-box-containing protein
METLPYVILAVGVSFLVIVAAIRLTLLHHEVMLYFHEARNKVPILILLGSIIWMLMSALEVASDSLPTKLVFFKMHFVGVLIVPTTWLILTMQLSGYERWVKRSNLVVLSVVPVITLLLIFTNESHGLMWSNITLNSVNSFFPLNANRGLGYWLLVVGYSNFALMFAVVIFLRRVIASRSLYRRQAVPLIFVSCVPWAFNAVWLLNPSLFMFIDPTPLGLTIAASITLWRLAYLPGADIIPVAHEMIVDSMNEAVIILDAQTRIVELNPRAQQLVGHNLSDALGKPVERMWAEWAGVKKELDSGTERVREVSFGVGEEKKVYEMLSSYLSGITSDRPNLLITLRDITERKILDEKLRLYSKQLKEHSEHLEDLVQERTKALQQAQRMATIGELAAMVGHDIRNPLQGIAIATHYLMTKEGSKLGEKGKEMLQLIQEDIWRSDKIINDLLDYSRELHLEQSETDAKSIVEDALTHLKIPAEIRVVDSTQNETKMILDAEKMRRVFLNLLQNAIDAMPKGGTLTITSKRSNGRVEIVFRDTGVGMTEETMRKLWNPLYTTKAKGMGFGLAISRRVVEAHEGSITVESRPGEGSTFTVSLPLVNSR